MKRISLLLMVCILGLIPARAQQYTIKFATLAPDGSTWMKVMKDFDAAVRRESGGRVGFRFFPGGVAGDEKDVVRKIRLNQYQAGGFTGVGIGEVAKNVRILDAPFLFHNYDEVDYIVSKFEPQFEQSINEGGFVLLGWAEVGFVYIFTDRPVSQPSDLKPVKMWQWEGDPIAESAFKAIGISPIPLSITDVMTSLQTGMINGVYTSPLALLALQWFTKVSYMMGIPLADSQGAVLISKRYFDSMPQDLQQILLKNGKKYFRQLTLASREENKKSIETIKSKGIKIIMPPQNVVAQFAQTGSTARRLLVNKLYSADFLNQIENELKSYRQVHK